MKSLNIISILVCSCFLVMTVGCKDSWAGLNIDDDCLIKMTWYDDTDNDGLGDPTKYLIACQQPEGYVINNDDLNPNCGEINVGDILKGGIVFYVDETCQHGKVCSKKNLGEFNWDDAISICETYEEDGYSDWYLPSKDEFNQMYKRVPNFSFIETTYWSSTENNEGKAWYRFLGKREPDLFGFVPASQGYSSKHYKNQVRAVRTF
jgi:hypothetical protein